MTCFSILTVVRNDVAGLGVTRASIAAQSCRDFEWRVVDGASADGTAQALAQFGEPYLSAVSEPDRGIFDAMNKALYAATGEFVVFLNAGDVFASVDTLQRVKGRLATSAADLLYGDSLEVCDGGRTGYKAALGHASIGYGMFACHQSMYFRRSKLGTLCFDPTLKVAGDYAFVAAFLRTPLRIERLHEALCIFDRGGTSHRERRRGRQENWRVQRDVLGLSLVHRCLVRLASRTTALLAKTTPALYHSLRFRKIDACRSE